MRHDAIPRGILRVLREDLDMGEDRITLMSPREVLDAWLTWEGIIGYTEQIIEASSMFVDVALQEAIRGCR